VDSLGLRARDRVFTLANFPGFSPYFFRPLLPYVCRKDRTGYLLGAPPSEAGLGSVFPEDVESARFSI
jgi:hypothetical protein